MQEILFKTLSPLFLVALVVLTSVWLTEKMQYRKELAEKTQTIVFLQEKLSKCQSNNIVFDGKVKKTDLNLRQFLAPFRPDTCQVDTASIVAWWDNLKPRERRKYRKENQ
jgi:LPS sulfotransferase NodH